MKKIKAIRLTADGQCGLVTIDNTLEELQCLVGGYIETLTIASDVALIFDEEGRLKGKPANAPIPRIFPLCSLVGDVLIVGVRGEEFADVLAAMAEYAEKKLRATIFEWRNEE